MSARPAEHRDEVVFRRGGQTETRHAVAIAVADASGRLVAAAGDPAVRTFWRSAAKPFQLLPFVACGGTDRYGFGDRELSVMAASHNGEAGHREVAAAILAAAGLDEQDLLCGVEDVDHPAWREALGAETAASPLWNNCSGKHAGMLAHCRDRGWPTADYRNPQHPLQVEIRHVVHAMTGEAAGAIAEGIDGCGVPTFHLSLRGMATAYARLVAGDLHESWRAAAARVIDAVAAEPWFLAGTGRLCTRLVQVAGARVIAKIGAAGMFCAALRDRGWGVALKVQDGSSRAAGIALIETLRQLGVLEDDHLLALDSHARTELTNHAGTPVGEVVPLFRLGPRG